MILETKKRGTGGADVTRELQGVRQGANALRGTWTELNSALSVGRQAVQMAGQAYQATVGQGLAYIDQIGQLAMVSGQGTEATSRLVQVLDDFHISGEQLTMGMRTLRTQGINPTVGEMARMSDEYLRLNPGLERQNYLATHFGTRVGPQFAYAMEQGSAAILANADTVNANLLVSQADFEQRQAMLRQLDAFQDWWLGAQVWMAGGFMAGLRSAEELLLIVGNTLGLISDEQMVAFAESMNVATAATEQVAGAIDNIPTERHTRFYVDADISPEADFFMRHFGSYIPGAATLGPIMLETYGGISGAAAGGGGGGAYGPPGGWAAWAAAHPGEFWGGAQGGAFDVIGPAGVDRVPVGFMATAGERVTVQTAEQQRRGGGGAGVHFHGDIHLGGDLDLAKFEKMLVRCLRG
jgi:hypothetical protein